MGTGLGGPGGPPSPLCTTTAATEGRLREQITLLQTKLTRIDRELAGLATTRSTLRDLAATEFTADDPAIVSAAYQQILAILRTATAGMRAEDVCLALDIEPLPKNVEGTREVETAGQPRNGDGEAARNPHPDP